jgi:hypothetical protein
MLFYGDFGNSCKSLMKNVSATMWLMLMGDENNFWLPGSPEKR